MNQAASQAGTRKLILGGWVAGGGSQSIVAGRNLCGYQRLSVTSMKAERRQAKKKDRPAPAKPLAETGRQEPSRFALRDRWPLLFTRAAKTRAPRPRWQRERPGIRGRPA
jgi:hypothetical protein